MEYPSLGTPPAGSIRFNTDSSKMEIYNGDKWWEIDSTSPEVQTGGTRGLRGGGESPGNIDKIEYANLDTTGNFVDFGDLTQARAATPGAGASRTRAFWAGGQHASTYYDNIDYVTISSTGAGLDFGNLQDTRRAPMVASNDTRGIILAGTRSGTVLNVNDYITIATTGNALDFGNLDKAKRCPMTASNDIRGVILAGTRSGTVMNNIDYITIATTGNAHEFADTVSDMNTANGACMSSPTRGVFAGGYGQPGATQIDCNYITFMTQGQQADFGDSLATKYGNVGCSNAIRGVGAGGVTSPAYIDVIEYYTLATLGNATDFGNLSAVRAYGCAMASSTRGVFAGGYETSPTGGVNKVEYVQIMTEGNAVDFGDIAAGSYWSMGGTSNGHGGLG